MKLQKGVLEKVLIRRHAENKGVDLNNEAWLWSLLQWAGLIWERVERALGVRQN